MARAPLLVSSDADLPEYPFGPDDRLDSHWFMPWERRRWLNSDMRLRGTPECRALYFDLINISYDHAPIGTLPVDASVLAMLVHVPEAHFRQLCQLEYGPLHRWERWRCGEHVRLGHHVVIRSLTEAVARKEDNRARTEAANASKRLQRLRVTVAGLNPDLAGNDAAIRWMDEWFLENGIAKRMTTQVERAIGAWNAHLFDLRRRQAGAS